MSFVNTARRSSNIGEVGYDPAKLQMVIGFKSGGRYLYERVSPRDHGVFMAQPSLGKAFNSMFYGKAKQYPSTKLGPTSGH